VRRTAKPCGGQTQTARKILYLLAVTLLIFWALVFILALSIAGMVIYLFEVNQLLNYVGVPPLLLTEFTAAFVSGLTTLGATGGVLIAAAVKAFAARAFLKE